MKARKMSKMVRSLVAILLVVIMAVSCASMSASASTAYVGPREYYWVQSGDAYYSSTVGAMVADFYRTDAAKICSVMDQIDSIFYLRYDVFRLEEWNSVGYMPYVPYDYSDGQGKTIASYLSNATLKRIENLDAEHAITVIKTTKEYRQNATLRTAVNDYLDVTLDSTRVRAALLILYPQLSDAINRWNISALVNFTNNIMKTQKYQRLQEVVGQLFGKTDSVEDFAKSMTEAKEAEYWNELSTALSGYGDWAKYVQTLNESKIVLPISTYESSEQISAEVVFPPTPAPVTGEPTRYGGDLMTSVGSVFWK